ncbi:MULTISPECIES: hypothetical protein [unclassified Nocardioides]|uniref:hypothetical protein n=1 Tax=unclassified Nocardioides TaxID=2615069 RepID=UPI00362341D9
MRRLGILLVAMALALPQPAHARADGEVPITQRAIAAMALEHAPDDTTHRQATWTGPHYDGGGLGADLRYHGDGEYDGDLLEVFVAPKHGTQHPCRGLRPHCESRTVETGRLTLSWGLETPEEDPGYVRVLLQRAGERVSALWAGDVITGDPRDQDLFIPVETLETIVQDPRISMNTTQEVVDAGAALPGWRGGEPDPHAGDRVPSTNRSLAWGYWLHTGGYAYYHHLRRSPLRATFGDDALGAQFSRERMGRDDPRRTIDVLASRHLPAWMSRHVCRTPRFAGHCLRDDGRRGPRYFAWIPGSRGQTWAVAVRRREVVVVRQSDFVVPAGRYAATLRGEWWMLRGLLNDRLIGLTTEKRVFDAF